MTLSARRGDQPGFSARAWDAPRALTRRPEPPSSWPAARSGPSFRAAPEDIGRAPSHRALARRLAGHLVLASLPLLAIAAHVFNLVPMHLTAGLLVLPLLVVIVVASGWRPLEQDRMLLRAAVVGAVATAVYDIIRLDTVYLLGWWGDFIPSIGAWTLNTDDPVTGLVDQPGLAATIVGYLWRYAGDGAGIGIWFYILTAALGLRARGPGITVGAAIAFAVAPVWVGLIATVGLAPRGDELMFPLTARTVALSLLGHLIFGLVLGIGAARTDRLERLWPWRPLPVPGLAAALDRFQGGPAVPATAGGPRAPSWGRHTGALPAGGWSAAVGHAAPGLTARSGEVTQLLPPTIEPRPESAQHTDLVAPPICAALPPAPPGPGRIHYRSGRFADPPRAARDRTGPQPDSPPASRPQPPTSGPLPVPVIDPAPTPDPRAGYVRGHPVAWGRLSRITSHGDDECPGA